MKDKKRIPKILKEIKKVWEKNSDLRFGQFILNISFTSKCDLYYLEDDELVKVLKRFYGKK